MIKPTENEQRILTAASKLREIVRADFERKAAPASRKLLNQLGPATHKLINSISDKTAISIALPLSSVLSNQAGATHASIRPHIERALKLAGHDSGAVTILKSAARVTHTAEMKEALVALKEAKILLGTLRKFR